MTRVFSLRSSAGLLAALLLLTGCDPILRFYGGDYGNTDAYQDQLVVLVDNFEATLEHNRADLARLVQATGANPALLPYTEQMTALVATQELVLAEQRGALDALIEEGTYRELNRSYGAFVTQQQMIADRYEDLARRLAGDARATSYVDFVVDASRYVFIPPQYDRIGNRLRTPGLPMQVAAPALTAPAPAAVPLGDSTMTTLSDSTAL